MQTSLQNNVSAHAHKATDGTTRDQREVLITGQQPSVKELVQNTMNSSSRQSHFSSRSMHATAYNSLAINGKEYFRLGLVLAILIGPLLITNGIGANFAAECENQSFSIFIVNIVLMLSFICCFIIVTCIYKIRVNFEYIRVADAKRNEQAARQTLSGDDI